MTQQMPNCPECHEPALEMTRGSGWKWSPKGTAKLCPSYLVDGKMRYRCVCGNEWEK